MNGFLALVNDVVRLNGLHQADIYLNREVVTLPGYFRPTKQWDMLVLNEKRLIAAIEFKSQVGPSFGNNFNNRTEEAIGSAVDPADGFPRRGLRGESAPFLRLVDVAGRLCGIPNTCKTKRFTPFSKVA